MESNQIEDIVDRYGDMVYRIALFQTRNNREDANDIFQDVFLALIKKICILIVQSIVKHGLSGLR